MPRRSSSLLAGAAPAAAGALARRRRSGPAAGVVLGRAAGRRFGRPGPLLRYNGPGRVLTVALERAGKTTGAVVPNLLDHPGPVVVLDARAEAFALTARFRADVLGHRVVALDPFGLAPDELFDRPGRPAGRGSVERGTFDPLGAVVRPGSPDGGWTADGLARAVDGASGRAALDGVDGAARSLLAGLVAHVAGGGLRDRPGGRSLLAVRAALAGGDRAVALAAREMGGSADPFVRRAGDRFGAAGDGERAHVVRAARASTAFLDGPEVSAAVGGSTFDPDGLRSDPAGRPADGGHGPLSVYVVPGRPEAGAGPWRAWLRLTLGGLLTAVERAGPAPVGRSRAPSGAAARALFLLDDAAALGPGGAAGLSWSTSYSDGVLVWALVQSVAQAGAVYDAGLGHGWMGQDVVQAFGALPGEDADALAAWAGRAGRPVAADDLRRWGPEGPVVLQEGARPVRARPVPYYDDPTFAGRAGGP